MKEEFHSAGKKTGEERRSSDEASRLADGAQMEAQVRAGEESRRYRDLFEFAPDGYIITDVEGNILDANQAAERLLEAPVTRLVVKGLADFVSDENQPDLCRFVQRLNLGEELQSAELWICSASGRDIPVEIKASPGLNSSGELVSIRWLLCDITGRRAVEEALRQANEELEARVAERTAALETANQQLQAENQAREKLLAENQRHRNLLERLVESAPAGIAFLQGPEHRYTVVNAAYLQIARGKGDLIGRTVADVWAEIAAEVVPMLDRVYETGEVISAVDQAYTIERQGQREENFFSFTFKPIYDEGDRVEGVMILAIETTDEVANRRQVEAERGMLNAILQQLPSGVILAEAPSGKVLRGNRRAMEILGQSIDDFNRAGEDIENRWFHLDGHPYRPEEWSLFRAIRLGETVEAEEVMLRAAEGECRLLSVSAAPVYDPDGQVVAGVAVLDDITERKQAEGALREAHGRLQWLVDSNVVGIVVIDSDGRVLEANDYYLNLLGYSREEMEAGLVWRDRITPEEHRQADVQARREIEARGICTPYRKEYYRKDGSRVWVLIGKAGLPDEENHTIGFVIDISAQKEAEQALQDSKERFRQLADAMPQLVWTAGPDGRVDYYNQRYLEFDGIVLSSGESWQWAPALHPDDEQPTTQAWEQALRTGEIYQIEHRARKVDGTFRWHLSRGVPARDAQGRIVKWYGTATDIHEQKQTEEALRESESRLQALADQLAASNRELEQFAFVASHDLQEPLRKVAAFGKRLQEHLKGNLDETTQDYLGRMVGAVQRMQRMVEDLLTYSRVMTRSQPFTQVDLQAVTQDVLYNLELQIERNAGEVIVGPLPVIEADESQIFQLLQNLVGNGLKYHRPGIPPRLEISATQQESFVELLIKDNGIGFDANEMRRMFEPFERLHGRGEYEGTGMGLAICRKIVERHAGEITAATIPGQGSTFIVRLPQRR